MWNSVIFKKMISSASQDIIYFVEFSGSLPCSQDAMTDLRV
jgi:hypothetical protein